MFYSFASIPAWNFGGSEGRKGSHTTGILQLSCNKSGTNINLSVIESMQKISDQIRLSSCKGNFNHNRSYQITTDQIRS